MPRARMRPIFFYKTLGLYPVYIFDKLGVKIVYSIQCRLIAKRRANFYKKMYPSSDAFDIFSNALILGY